MNLYVICIVALFALLFSPRLGARLWAEVQYALGGKVRWQLPVWSAVSVCVVVLWSAVLAHFFHLQAKYAWAILIAFSFTVLLAAPSVYLIFSRKKIPTTQVKSARGGAKFRTRNARK
jgi:hypothetical protein